MPEAAVKFNFYMKNLPPSALEFFKDQMQNWFDYLYELSTEYCEDQDLKATFISKLKELNYSKYARLSISQRARQEVQLSQDFQVQFNDLCANPAADKLEVLLNTFQETNSLSPDNISNPYIKTAIEKSSKTLLIIGVLISILVDQFDSASDNYLNVLEDGEDGDHIRLFIYYAFKQHLQDFSEQDKIKIQNYVFNHLPIADHQSDIYEYLKTLTTIPNNKYYKR